MNDSELRLGLGELKAAIGDTPALLKQAGTYMLASIHRTMLDDGSPAGSWPKLALSTMRKKRYTAGHQLLVLSGRLFGDIFYTVQGNTLTMVSNKPYSAVQNFGSADRRGAGIGPQAKLPGRGVTVKAHDFTRIFKAKGRGKNRTPARTVTGHQPEHTRHQNIPGRAFMVFRPEDPGSIVSGWERFLAGRAVRLNLQTGGAA